MDDNQMSTRFRSAGLSLAALVTLLTGCISTPPASVGAEPLPSPPPTTTPSLLGHGQPPPALDGLTTLLLRVDATGPEEVGSFEAVTGDLWIRGRCSPNGTLELRLDPAVMLPIPCDSLGDLPYENQITLSQPRKLTLSVVAPQDMTWGLRVEQKQD